MTQKQAILAHLRTGASITPLEALEKYGCFRLASVIHELRRDGHQIETDDGKHGKKHFAIYKLISCPPKHTEGCRGQRQFAF